VTPELESYLDKFRTTVAEIFASTNYRSVMLAVSQYWADEADDAVHDTLVASVRDLPLWPHRCTEDDDTVTSIPGEACARCGEGLPDYLQWWSSNGDAVAAFEAWCHESGSQESPEIENALPCLVARRGENGVEVSFIGKPQRIESLLYRHLREWDADHTDGDDDDDDDDEDKPVAERGEADTAWGDPRALQLFEQVCTHPSDDSARRVLADYLLERDEPRGELIATALDAATNPAVKERYDALFRERFSTWFHPLGRSSPDATAVFDRGFLVKCDLLVGSDDDVDRLRGAPVLGTVEHLRVHGGRSILHPVMRALRTLGPIDETWLVDLVASPIAWSIEHLEVELDDEAAIELLRSATNLPALRELWLSGELCEAAVRELPKAAWWSQLQRLAIADRDVGAAGIWHARHRELGVPWLAVQQAYTDPTNALGWELAFGPSGACEATLRGFTPHATFGELAKMAKQVPFVCTLVASDYYAPAASDLASVYPTPNVSTS
jgi:uncharacterized protein (TIGR02996 family)